MLSSIRSATGPLKKLSQIPAKQFSTKPPTPSSSVSVGVASFMVSNVLGMSLPYMLGIKNLTENDITASALVSNK